MKKLILAIAILGFASCKKCFDCTTTITYKSNVGSTALPKNAESRTTYCAKSSEIAEYEKQGTSTTTAKLGTVTITEYIKTTCE